MDKIMRYLGIIIVLLGVITLVLYYCGAIVSNGTLLTAGVLFVVGVVMHIFMNKKFAE